jgi:hypothetical protein
MDPWTYIRKYTALSEAIHGLRIPDLRTYSLTNKNYARHGPEYLESHCA